MDQSITLKIAGKEYSLKASSPETEELMRLAAEDVNKMLARYTERFHDKTLEDKFALVSLQEALFKITAQRKMQALAEEVVAFKKDTDAYLMDIEKK